MRIPDNFFLYIFVVVFSFFVIGNIAAGGLSDHHSFAIFMDRYTATLFMLLFSAATVNLYKPKDWIYGITSILITYYYIFPLFIESWS